MTIRQAYLAAAAHLKVMGIDSPEFDAAQLLEAATGVTRATLPLEGNREMTQTEQDAFFPLVRRRGEKYPLQYLLGKWEFYGLPFVVGEGVLIPRADTETLVETGLELLKDISHPVVYDLCSGSGCIAAAIASQRPDAAIYAVELSEQALSYLRQNVRPFPGVKVIQGDVLETAPQLPPCHLLLSNPPYISDEEMERLQTEVTYEPEMALRAGNQGLYFYQKISEQYLGNLLPGGHMAFEVGHTQSTMVSKILEKAGMHEIAVRKDLSGIERVVAGRKPF